MYQKINYMIELTKEELKRRYIKYNNDYFNGKLMMCSFGIFRGKKTAMGNFAYGSSYKRPIIRISNFVNWTDDSLRDILVHEMVHCYVRTIIHYNGMFVHGIFFTKKARELNKKYGLHVYRVQNIYFKNEKIPITKSEKIKHYLKYFCL